MASSGNQPSGRGRLSGLRVLIAEDSWLIADTLAVLLEEEGARVVGPAASCADSLELLGRQSVDFALVDMKLTDAFADQLAEELVSLTIPYAVITGIAALPSHAHDDAVMVLYKPIVHKTLIELLSGYVARDRPTG